MKMAAATRWADKWKGMKAPIFLQIRSSGGHGDSLSIEEQLIRSSQGYGFLMEQVGLDTEKTSF